PPAVDKTGDCAAGDIDTVIINTLTTATVHLPNVTTADDDLVVGHGRAAERTATGHRVADRATGDGHRVAGGLAVGAVAPGHRLHVAALDLDTVAAGVATLAPAAIGVAAGQCCGAGDRHCVAGDIAGAGLGVAAVYRSEEHTSELQSRFDLVCRLL